MTNLKISFLLLCSLFFFKGSSQTNAEASEYMYEVTKKAFELNDETWQYLKAVTRGKKASKVEDKRQELVRAIKTAQLSTARRKDFNGSTAFRDAIVDYLDLNYTVLKGDYDKILDMEAIAEQSYDAMEAYLLAQEQASAKLDSAFQIMSNAQNTFAEQYGIELSESKDKMVAQIQKASETLEYYNDIYLIFFKSYKQEAYVLEAIEQSDVSSIEQNNNTLQSFSAEGLNKLKEQKSFKGDASLINAAKKALEFYQEESKNEFSQLSDFFLKKDEFEKLSQRIENMPKKERTQEVIDQYNKVVNDYNALSQNFNSSMQSAYNKRTKMLNDWNKKVDYFISNHSK